MHSILLAPDTTVYVCEQCGIMQRSLSGEPLTACSSCEAGKAMRAVIDAYSIVLGNLTIALEKLVDKVEKRGLA